MICVLIVADFARGCSVQQERVESLHLLRERRGDNLVNLWAWPITLHENRDGDGMPVVGYVASLS